MDTCKLCEAPREPGEQFCRHHLLEKQERRTRNIERIYKIGKYAVGVVAAVLYIYGMFKGDSSDS